MTEKSTKAEKPSNSSKAVVAEKENRNRPERITRDMLVNKGPLQIPPGFKKPGFKNLWICVRDDNPYEYSKWEVLGYSYATHAETGAKCIVGKSNEKNVLLEIPEELHAQIQEHKKSIRREVTAQRTEIENPRVPGRTEGIFEERLTIK